MLPNTSTRPCKQTNNGILSLLLQPNPARPINIQPLSFYPSYRLLIAVELLENQMQKQININPDSSRSTPIPTFAKQIHKLMVVKLRLQEPIKRDFRKRTRNHHAALRTLDLKDTRLVRAKGDFEAIPLALRVSVPRHQDALLREIARRVLEGPEAVGPACRFEFAHVVVLAGEGEEELLLALLRLQRYHGLLDIVVVRLELLFEEMCFLVQGGERVAHAFHFASTLHAAAVLGTDVDRDRVEQVLVVVVRRDATGALKLDHVLQTILLQGWVIQFKHRVGAHVGGVG